MPIINSVITQGGIQPTGTKNITTNGTHNVADYEYADVAVPTTAPYWYIGFINDNNVLKIDSTLPPFPNDVTDIGASTWKERFKDWPNVFGNLDLSNFISISGSYACKGAFTNCGITSINLSSLTTVSGYEGCSNMFSTDSHEYGLTSVDLHSLETISGGSACQGMFYYRRGLINVDLRSLITISSWHGCYMMFWRTGLTSFDFPSLTNIKQSLCCESMFGECFNLSTITFYALTPASFGSYTNQFQYMLRSVTGCTVHFPIAVQATIGSWSDVTNGFGGTSTTVLFDIVTSLTGADTNTYTRKQKDSTSTATAWTYNDTLYYTSGTAEPTVGATIYSDAACTTAVTTISSIA